MRRDVAQALSYALSRGFQVHPDALLTLEGIEPGALPKIMRDLVKEKGRRGAHHIEPADLDEILGVGGDEEVDAEFKVVSDPTGRTASGEGAAGYAALFKSRFEKLRAIVADRPEIKRMRTIESLASSPPPPPRPRGRGEEGGGKKGGGRDGGGGGRDADPYVCGLVADKSADRMRTRVTIDDPTGSIDLVAFDEEVRRDADALFNDQLVVARVAAGRGGGLVAREIMPPGVADTASRRSKTEAYAVLLSDLHVGSRFFLEREFRHFVGWLAGPDPTARRVRFVMLCGDVVDGVGIYPEQDKELVQQTAGEQMSKLASLLSLVPGHIRIFVIPGNHDPGRRALPQPAIPKEVCPEMYDMPNVEMLGNPASVSLNGVRVTMFHGQSIDDLVKAAPGLSYDEPAPVMEALLKARHLSPIYGSQTPIAPESEDMLVIDEVPDILHMGHVHRLGFGKYRGVLMINSGTWQSQTPFQQARGIQPDAGQAVLVNLKTLSVLTKDCIEGAGPAPGQDKA